MNQQIRAVTRYFSSHFIPKSTVGIILINSIDYGLCIDPTLQSNVGLYIVIRAA